MTKQTTDIEFIIMKMYTDPEYILEAGTIKAENYQDLNFFELLFCSNELSEFVLDKLMADDLFESKVSINSLLKLSNIIENSIAAASGSTVNYDLTKVKNIDNEEFRDLNYEFSYEYNYDYEYNNTPKVNLYNVDIARMALKTIQKEIRYKYKTNVESKELESDIFYNLTIYENFISTLSKLYVYTTSGKIGKTYGYTCLISNDFVQLIDNAYESEYFYQYNDEEKDKYESAIANVLNILQMSVNIKKASDKSFEKYLHNFDQRLENFDYVKASQLLKKMNKLQLNDSKRLHLRLVK